MVSRNGLNASNFSKIPFNKDKTGKLGNIMTASSAMPPFLIERYRSWRKEEYEPAQSTFESLSVNGQFPHTMVISCCDSRVHPTQIFAATEGEIFMHRNIANLIPAYQPNNQPEGTSAALQFAVTALKVKHLVILGHSDCGGVAGCYHMCSGSAPELEEPSNFVGRWVNALRPAFADLPDGDLAQRKTAFEKAGVVMSLNNAMSFPFIAQAVEEGRLSLHGLWTDIRTGILEQYDQHSDSFMAV